jgi:hypothetical protein
MCIYLLNGHSHIKTRVAEVGVTAIAVAMHIKLSASRKLLWHYRVTTPTIMLASKELPYDDHTTGGPCYA